MLLKGRLFGLLFALCMEILVKSIKQDSEVQDILVKGKEIKICQYVDDTTGFVRRGTSGDKQSINQINQFIINR